jgi:hypothetical protein
VSEIVGNVLIALMSLTALTTSPIILALLLISGPDARYFCTPTRQAWLVNLSKPQHELKIFRFPQAPGVGVSVSLLGIHLHSHPLCRYDFVARADKDRIEVKKANINCKI